MKPDKPAKASELRRRAEEKLKNRRAETRDGPAPHDLRRLLHELQVHQSELEMQNEELQRAHTEIETALEKYTDLYDFAPTGYFTLTSDGTIRAVNLTGASLVGVERSQLVNRGFSLLVSKASRPDFIDFLTRIFVSDRREFCELALVRDSLPSLVVRVEGTIDEGGQVCRAAVLDITERHQTAVERDRLIEELQQALARVKQLSGLLPICASCKKIRDDDGYWKQVESYISSHSGAKFSHGICPECMARDFSQYDNTKASLG